MSFHCTRLSLVNFKRLTLSNVERNFGDRALFVGQMFRHFTVHTHRAGKLKKEKNGGRSRVLFEGYIHNTIYLWF